MQLAAIARVPSTVHEAMIELLRGAPERILDLLHDALGNEPARDLDVAAAAIVDATLPQHVAPARLCDLAIEIPLRSPPASGPVGTAVLVEIQLHKDHDKELSWPIYWALTRARPSIRGGPVWLVVVTLQAAVERWAIATLSRVLPPIAHAVVIGPSTMPRVIDPIVARRDPVTTLLSGLIHGGEHDRDLVPAIAAAHSTLAKDRGKLFLDAIAARLSRIAFTDLETKMQKKKTVQRRRGGPEALLRSRRKAIARMQRYHEQICQLREQGFEYDWSEEHRHYLMRRSLFVVLETRGLKLRESQRTRIYRCDDLETLADWLQRAAETKTVAAIFEESKRPARRAAPTAPQQRRTRTRQVRKRSGDQAARQRRVDAGAARR